ncbi:MAG TPA: phosphate acyltransferase PlsX [Candidatus Hydrogenedens sp.]|nr:phosphate acyltransferase PlsX [Candidatus Hydrogenedens sp.]HPP57566.1 phosphate acyltransferase PlsX [Candidatus Hydrogenedens sp.]
MRIALDAMGSDGAPAIEVQGAVEASLERNCDIILFGDEELLKKELDKYPKRGNIEVVHTPEYISMHDQPVIALRQKKESSLLVALRKLKIGEVDAVVSAGNTGAVMVGSRIVLGIIEGISRPALAQALPTKGGRVVLLDLGANVDCQARHLCDFAIMGAAYSHYALGVEKPRVGLINIGEEMIKGSVVLKQAFQILSKAENIYFIGNVEPNSVFEGEADVVVCDGFVGNIILKTAESVAKFVGIFMKEQLLKSSMNRLGAVLARSALQELKKTVNPNEYPGAPLLGVQGVVIALHGASSPLGIANGIRGAIRSVKSDLVGHIGEKVKKFSIKDIVEPEEKLEIGKDTLSDSSDSIDKQLI